MNDLMQSIPNEKNVLIGGDLNGHVESDGQGYENVQRGFGLIAKMKKGEASWILPWCTT